MKKTITKILIAVTAICMLFAVGCSKDPEPAAPTADGISITGKAGSLIVGDTLELGYSVSPDTVSGVEVEWSSSVSEVASVTSEGKVTALKKGSTIISITVKGTQIKDNFALSVTEPIAENPATAIAIEGAPSGKVYIGGAPIALTAKLTAVNEGVCTDTVKWSSGNDAIVTVDANGNVTPRKVGTATVKAAVVGKTDELFDECTINVYPAVPQDGIYKDSLKNVSIGGASGVMSVATLDADILLGGTRYGNISYALDTNSEHAGSLLMNGNDIRNYDRTYLELKHEDILSPEKDYYVKASVTLVSAGNIDAVKTANWMLCWWDTERACKLSEDDGDTHKSISSLGETGRVLDKFSELGETKEFLINTNKPIRGISFGTSQTTDTTGVGNSSYTVRLNWVEFGEFKAVEEFAISNKEDLATVRTDATGESAKTVEVTHAGIAGGGTSNLEVLFASSNEDVLTIDASGKITPVAPGTATVTAKVKGQESTAFDSVEITVVHVPVEGLTITQNGSDAPDTVVFDVKDKSEDSWKLEFSYKVSNEPCPYTVVWSSSDETVATVNNGVVTLHKVGSARITLRVEGQSAQDYVDIKVEDSSTVSKVESIAIKINGELAGSEEQIVRLGDNVVLSFEAKFEDGTKFTVTWATSDGKYIDIPAGSEHADSVTLNIKEVTTGDNAVAVKVSVDGEATEHVVYFKVRKPLITSLNLANNETSITLKNGENKSLVFESTPADCDDYNLDFTYSLQNVAVVTENDGIYTLDTLGEGVVTITATVAGTNVAVEFTVNVSGDIDVSGGVETETFKRGEIKEETWYEGKFFNVGARSSSSAMNPLTLGENGLVWNVWTLGDQRIMFGYNNFDALNVSSDKKYVARVALTTPENFPAAGYIMVYGFKKEACESYKVPNAGTDVAMMSEGGSTARVVLGGKNETTYFDFIFDGTTSGEFYIAFHSASNSGKQGMTADITVSKIELFELDAYENKAETETFDIEEAYTVNGFKYTGEHFDMAAPAGDGAFTIVNMPAPQLSMFTSGKGLYWISPRVWKKGLTTNDEGDAVTHNAKMEITYKGVVSDSDSYHARIPLFMKATNAEQVKTTTVELYYVSADGGKENLLTTKTIGWTQALTVFEVDIPQGSNWNGKLVLRMYNSAITAQSAGSKMLCYFDGISVERIPATAEEENDTEQQSSFEIVATGKEFERKSEN